MNLVQRLGRWEGKWVLVESCRLLSDPLAGTQARRGRLLAVGPDHLVIRGVDGVEIVIPAIALWSVALVADQAAAELEALAAATEREDGRGRGNA